jgi:hypothetical protein
MSNLIIDEAMVEARWLSAEALEMMSKAYEMRDNFEEQIITERNRVSARLHKERVHHSRESERLQRNQAMSIEKHQQEKASLVKEVQSKSNVKYHKVREHVAMVSKKLKEQHLIWQTRLRDMDSSSKNQLSKERARRRNMVQQQLDRSSAVEGQLRDIIKGLEIMNSELADELKSAKKAKCEAIRLYDKSKEAATRRLDQLRQEKEQKNLLKDKLTHVQRAQQAQEVQITEYKSMVETFKSSKQDLTCEFKAGRRGGAHWPLWVTEVCCELLVNRLPPSAIPSSIMTLFAALYSEEPKKILSLNYVRQCRVLVQIISETIMAMKLAACPLGGDLF